MDETDNLDASRLFPEAECVTAVGELSAWTSVQTILAAARHIEGRPTPKDELVPMLILPFDDDKLGLFSSIIVQVMKWLIAGYSVPEPKVALACSIDPQISEPTASALVGIRFKPDIAQAAPGVLAAIPAAKSAFVVRDDPAVIEMIQAPLICMMELLRRCNETASQARLLLNKNKSRTGDTGTIYHHAYADSRLSAVLEAACFYAWGLDFGPLWGKPGQSDIDMAYRSINLHGVPPIEARFIEITRKSMETMLDNLR